MRVPMTEDAVPERVWVTFHGKDEFLYADLSWVPIYEHAQPYRIYPESEAKALLDVATQALNAVRVYPELQSLIAAIDRLDTSRSGD